MKIKSFAAGLALCAALLVPCLAQAQSMFWTMQSYQYPYSLLYRNLAMTEANFNAVVAENPQMTTTQLWIDYSAETGIPLSFLLFGM